MAELRSGGSAASAALGTGSARDDVRRVLAHGRTEPRLILLTDCEAADASELSGTFAFIQQLRDTRTLRVLVLGTYRPAELNTGHHPMREARQELERYGVAHELAVIAHCGIGTARLKLGNASGAIASERAARALVSGDPDSLTESSEALQLFSARLAAAAADFRFLGATPDALRAERLLQEKRLPAVERYACRAPLRA